MLHFWEVGTKFACVFFVLGVFKNDDSSTINRVPTYVAFHLLLGDPKPPPSPSEDFLVTLMCLFCMYLLSLGLN